MELAFVTRALRRYAWVVVLCAVLATVPAIALTDSGPPSYRSEAVVLVAPPTESQFTVHLGGDRDRYVSGQLSVLRSRVLAERVARRLDDGITAQAVASVVTVSNEAGTDVVTISATTEDPERSQQIADAYLDVYFESIRGQLEATQAPMLAALDQQIEDLRTEIAQVDEAMVAVMAPFLDADTIPSLEQVAPGLISDKSILLAQLTDLQASRTQLRVGPRVASEIVQEATLPEAPEPTFRRTLMVIGVMGGLFAGVLGAVAMARFSTNVLTDEQAEEILGTSVVGVMPELRHLTGDRRSLLAPLPPGASDFVETLCVRSEASNPEPGSTLTVVVTGSERGAGATTLAAAVARRFTDGGARVLIVDSDRHYPELTQVFVGSVPLRDADAASAAQGRRARQRSAPVVETSLPSLRVGTLITRTRDDSPGGSRLGVRQVDLERFVESASAGADVLVFDGGALMGSVSTVQLVRHCDVVILAMPRRQSIRGLELVAAELDDRQVLPVWSPRRSRLTTLLSGRFRAPAARRDDGVVTPPVSSSPDDPVDERLDDGRGEEVVATRT